MKILQESKVVKKVFLTVFAVVVVVLSLAFSGEEALAAEDDVVYIPDKNFKAMLNEKLGVKDTAADITEGQLATITSLTITDDDKVKDIMGIEYCTNITSLTLKKIPITDSNKEKYMSSVSSLVNIERLSMQYCDIDDEHTSMFNTLTKLKDLDLLSNNISSLDFILIHKDNLERLNLYSCNEISNGNVLGEMANLEMLCIRDTSIKDFSFVSEMPKIICGYEPFNWTDDVCYTYEEILIDVDKEVAANRACNRLICDKCKKVYNKELVDSKICISCGGNLISRDDDTKEVYINRYNTYMKETNPLISYYKSRVIEINNNGKIEDLFKKIDKIFEGDDSNDNN